MKALHYLSMLLIGGAFGASLVGCEKDEVTTSGGGNESTEMTSLYRGIPTDRPLKRITMYTPKNNPHKGKISEITYQWKGNYITEVVNNFYSPSQNGRSEFMGSMQSTFEYQKDKIICRSVEKYIDSDENIVTNPEELCVVQLNAEGYPIGWQGSYDREEQVYDSETGNYVKISYALTIQASFVLDAQHRIAQEIEQYHYDYKPEDKAWLEERQQYVRKDGGDTLQYKYTVSGDLEEFVQHDEDGMVPVTAPLFYSDKENKNGFFIPRVHCFSRLGGNDVGPYSMLNAAVTKHLPSRVGHEMYSYEVDKEGYVTKIYKYRWEDEQEDDVPYCELEY